MKNQRAKKRRESSQDEKGLVIMEQRAAVREQRVVAVEKREGLSILIIRPRFKEAAVIGLLAGAICQFFPGTPYINFMSELVGALVMAAFMYIPIKQGKFSPIPVISTFISTLASGFTFIAVMYLIFYAGADVKPVPLAIFMGIIFGTAAINSVIVQILYVPLKLALKRN